MRQIYLKACELASKSSARSEFIRFLFVGGLNTLFGYAIYVAFILVGLSISLSLALATIAGVIFNFFTTGHLVFNNRDKKRFFKFLLVYGLVYLINLSVLKMLVAAGAGAILAQLIALPFIAVLTFICMKFIVFQKNNKKAMGK
jgi:putative flippase GtrA